MKILHTSDWHIGRTFHGFSTLAHLREVLAALVELVRKHSVDVVVVAGDVFDSATPAADYYEVLTDTFTAIREAGAVVVATSGNHDSATRLGFQSGFAARAGVHVITRFEQHDQPVTIDDEHGPVHFYGIPYLEPALVRHLVPETTMRTHAEVLSYVMHRIRQDAARRGGRYVVAAHAFIANVEASDVERDITAGGLDFVPRSVFDGPDYVALGHIHGRQELSAAVRYSGAPLHYSFAEAHKPRGVWLVDMDASGLGEVRALDLPVPRPLAVLTGPLDQLLGGDEFTPHENSWVSAQLTDQTRPLDAMRRLQKRFPYTAQVVHLPATIAERGAASYSQRIVGKSDVDIVASFLSFVRNGMAATPQELALVAEAFREVDQEGRR